jgi:hypothetical protein
MWGGGRNARVKYSVVSYSLFEVTHDIDFDTVHHLVDLHSSASIGVDGSSVSIVNRLRVGHLRFNIREGQGSFSSLTQHPDRPWGPHVLLTIGYQQISHGIKAAGT